MMPVSRLFTTLLAGLALAGCGWGGPPQPLFTARGVITDALGQPVAGAVVSDGQVGVLTDEGGAFAIGVFETRLTVRKPGFQTANMSAWREGISRQTLSAVANRPRVAVDTRWVGDRMDGFKERLGASGAAVQPYPGTALGKLDVLMLVTPGAFRQEELVQVRAWVRGGGRLILCGEWGGYPAQDLDLLNALAKDAGITFTGATVKLSGTEAQGEEWLSIKGISPPSLAKLAGDEPLNLYTTTSLSVVEPAVPIFATDRRAYGVLAARTGPQVLAAVGACGQGKVFALGDSSLWLDEDSGSAGSANWQRGANFALAQALMRW